MSRFFATGDTESESSSESSDEEQKVAGGPAKTAKRAQYMFSDDEEDEKRVVRSQKDKRYDELRDIIHGIKNGQKIKDVTKVQTGFDSLLKAFLKAKTVIEKEGTPRFYIRALMELEDFVKELWDDKEAKQKLTKINARALTSLRQKVRKYNKDYEAEIESYREHPIESEGEGEGEGAEEEDSEAEEKSGVEPTGKATKEPTKEPAAKEEFEEDDDDDIDWEMSESESSESEEEGERVFGYTPDYFLKKTKDQDQPKEGVKVRKIRDVKKKTAEEEEEDEEKGGWVTVQRKSADQLSKQEVKKLLFGKDNVEVDLDLVRKKRAEIVSGRRKKTMDHAVVFERLKMLLTISKEANLGVGMELQLVTDQIATTFDIPSVASSMKDSVWINLMEYLDHALDLLEASPAVEFEETMRETYPSSPDEPFVVEGSILIFVERLDEEFTKILQATDAHSTEYVSKLQWEAKVTEVIRRVQHLLEQKYLNTHPNLVCRIYIRRIEHLYYKIDRKYLGEMAAGEMAAESEEESSVEMARLTKYIYSCDGQAMGRIRTRAMLCHIYHHALHDRFRPARDLMLMSHLQEGISLSDIPTQILYNRALVQLGMCAFRYGMIKDAHDALVDIQSSGRSKELLAQGLISRHERSLEQEKLERRRHIPFHMHINLELMECSYLTSAMLQEIPYMAAAEREGRRRLISKSFHHQLKYHEKQPLVGPPESMREHVVAAAHAMKKGDWKTCKDYILKIKAWELFINVDRVKDMLARKIQEETLRTYIFTHSEIYDSLSLERLSEMFELPLKTVHSIVSKMIIREEFLASLDEPTQTIVVHHAKPNQLQSQALLLAEKIGVLADHNEELMKLKHAGPWNVSEHHGQQGPYYGQRQGHGTRQGQRQNFNAWQSRRRPMQGR